MADRLLLATTLRDDYEVLARDDGSYVVAAIDRNGTRHEDRVGAQVADWLRERLRGRTLDKDEAAEILAPVAERLALPFTYGRKLGFHAQKVLLVLVARGEAGFEKNGRRFIYTVY